MRHRIVPFRTWADKDFKKDFKKLPEQHKQRCETALEELITALAACSHPTAEATLQRFRPTAYRVRHKGDGALLEYRLPGTVRVIVCWHEESATIVLVAITVRHDHDRLQRLIQAHGGSLKPPFDDP